MHLSEEGGKQGQGIHIYGSCCHFSLLYREGATGTNAIALLKQLWSSPMVIRGKGGFLHPTLSSQTSRTSPLNSLATVAEIRRTWLILL